MPSSNRYRPCTYPLCPHVTNHPTGYCEQHLTLYHRQVNANRGTSTERGYNYRWHKASKLFLNEHPLCAICLKKDPPVIRAAECVDHIVPHKGNQELFWDVNNWQSACLQCNSEKAAREEGAFGNKEKMK